MGNVREHERFYLSYYLNVVDRATDLSIGHCVNISNGGMMIIGEKPIPTETIFQLRMFLPEEIDGSRYVNFVAVTHWCKKDENPDFYDCGFQWHNITPEVIQVIKHLIENFSLSR